MVDFYPPFPLAIWLLMAVEMNMSDLHLQGAWSFWSLVTLSTFGNIVGVASGYNNDCNDNMM